MRGAAHAEGTDDADERRRRAKSPSLSPSPSPAPAPPPPPPLHLHLHGSDFHRALSRHLDEARPDPAARRQLGGLSLSWIGNRGGDGGDDDDGSGDEGEGGGGGTRPPPPLPRCCCAIDSDDDDERGEQAEGDESSSMLRGTLRIGGEYVGVHVCAERSWRPCRRHHSRRHVLRFRLTAWAEHLPPPPGHGSVTAGREGGGGGDFDAAAATPSVARRMRRRFEEDAYVSKLLRAAPAPTSTPPARQASSEDFGRTSGEESQIGHPGGHRRSRNRPPGVPLCEAIVVVEDEDANTATAGASSPRSSFVEERADASDDALEGVRRAVLSRAFDDDGGGNLSVLEFLLSMPWLPRPPEAGGGGGDDDDAAAPTSSSSSSSGRCPLFRRACHRAALRLLEDALVDACEREGEGEMLDDLTLEEVGERVEDRKNSAPPPVSSAPPASRDGGAGAWRRAGDKHGGKQKKRRPNR